ncbi:hypothetical protein FVA81_24830 [Rhizobium sp. WL3]|uniref:SPOR domain-containing protein n=1 Tax=Rhizobium sp. WL3 TaxID=2603277 RepID=UPI0011C1E37A|nr:SPOR domain-containing protein [Rhizobium sp. WL3]QEE47630.1 hypothetical protein FVA81_24830 [Rhizobium sp. WL3]
MVQKQAANMRSQGDGFADDDPLAELARIVGFDQPLKREPVVTLPQAPDMGSADFNLEDELMREFDGYEATPDLASYAPALEAPEPVLPRPSVVEAYEAPRHREEPSFEPEAPSYVVPAAAPDVTYEPEHVEFVAADVPYADVYAPIADPYVADLVLTSDHDEVRFEPIAEPEVTFDLADELEFAVADADIRPEPVAALSRPVHPEPPRLRLPLANFSAQPVRRAEPPVAVQPPMEVPALDLSSFDAPSAPSVDAPQPLGDLDFGKPTFDWASGPVEPIPAVSSSAPAVAMTPTPVPQFDPFALAMDPPVAPASTQTAHRVADDEPDFGFDFLDDLAFEEDAPVAPKVEEPVAQRAAPAVSDEDFDPFADQEFELQLDEIDLDLSDIDVAPEQAQSQPAPAIVAAAASAAPVFAAAPAPQASPEPMVAPSFAAAPVAASFSAALTPSVSSSYSAPMTRPAAETYAPAPVQSSVPVRSAAPMDDSFGFDPSEISEQDDMLETLSGMDVPDVPVAEARPAQPAQPDYDIDIDAELATLFEEPVAPAQPKPVAAGRVSAAPVTAAPQAAAQPLEDFDAFEKALEEDLLTTMSASGHFEPESRGHITIAGEGQGFRFRRIKPYLMAGTAVVMLLAGAGGLYAWLGSGAVGSLSGGEPQVIAADKTPVKIVPENPGGKSVPNQDKAVYDRVAGNGIEDPKQTSLISSEEQPVDVVQRTLIPESLPMEGGSEAMATPVGETEDPRLLPDGQPQQAAAEDPATITPRRVRTMIVRPDGTLVAQEVPAEPAPIETSAATPAQVTAATPVLAPPSVPSANAVDTVRTVDTRVVTPGGPTEAAVSATVPAASADAAAELAAATPETIESLSATDVAAAPAATDPSAPRAPIPTSRPADQPVNVVGTVTDQGNVRPAQSAATAPAEASTEVAAASPAAATQAPAAAAPAGSFGIQIASLPSEADAQTSYRNLSSKFGNVLGGKPWEIRQADIPGKGTFYRVRVVAGSKEQAVALCEQYRSAGGSCLVSR